MYKLTHAQLAWRVAQDLARNSSVYTGPGLPRMVSAHAASSVVFDTTGAGAPPDLCIFGARQVCEHGALALCAAAPADTARELALAAAAKQVFVMMDFFAADGSATLVPLCSGAFVTERCVTRVYTDIAILDLSDGKVILRELIEGITLPSLQMELEVELQVSPHLRLITAPALQ